MKSLAELEEIRKKALGEISVRNSEENFRIVVGMATCGIAAGARPVMNTLIEEINKRNIKNVTVTMTGCIGMCHYEPIVEVIDNDGNKSTYINMDSEKAKKVILDHIVNGQVVSEYTIKS